jgi:hypothetical protein
MRLTIKPEQKKKTPNGKITSDTIAMPNTSTNFIFLKRK